MTQPPVSPQQAQPAWDSKAYRASVRRDRDAGRIPRYRARTLLSALDLADRHGAALPDPTQTINFLGLGEVRGALSEIDGSQDGDWYFVHELIVVTGTTADDWFRIRDEEHRECAEADDGIPPRYDEYTVHNADGTRHNVPVCNWQLGMLLALDGPWGEEIGSNLAPAFRRAAITSGLADTITGLADAILGNGPLPSAEVAHHQATAGPLAAFKSIG
ncbi:hypothetical protein AB0J30_08835 [Streptomyces microflavus]|uniref:hypothetical protein n=1 Tax=Streptomyces microflavus TaxID=1919 RepID=UPI003446F8DE